MHFQKNTLPGICNVRKIDPQENVFPENVFAGKKFDDMFFINGTKHPQIVKEHLAKSISLESMVLLNKVIGFKNNFDKKMDDHVWKFLSMRMSKYDSFLHIDVIKYRKILKGIVV